MCSDQDSKDDRIVHCNVCKVDVHMLCYGVEQFEDSWICSPCRISGSEPVICALCYKEGGALKRTSCGKGVHVICAPFTDGVVFEDENMMEPIDIANVIDMPKWYFLLPSQ